MAGLVDAEDEHEGEGEGEEAVEEVVGLEGFEVGAEEAEVGGGVFVVDPEEGAGEGGGDDGEGEEDEVDGGGACFSFLFFEDEEEVFAVLFLQHGEVAFVFEGAAEVFEVLVDGGGVDVAEEDDGLGGDLHVVEGEALADFFLEVGDVHGFLLWGVGVLEGRHAVVGWINNWFLKMLRRLVNGVRVGGVSRVCTKTSIIN